jgi:hypothetical protein
MSPDIRAPVRYGTSFNQLNDGVLCWRDFLKLVCDDLDAVVPAWPDAPADLRCASKNLLQLRSPIPKRGSPVLVVHFIWRSESCACSALLLVHA